MSGKLNFATIYAFGDSLSDAGNVYALTSIAPGVPVRPVSPPYFHEDYGLFAGVVFTNGPTWVQDLSLSLGLGTLEPSFPGYFGNDFAYGGAETGPAPYNTSESEQSVIGLQAQLDAFEAIPGTPDPTDLYTLWIGGNDIYDILLDTTLTPDQQQADIAAAVNNELVAVDRLVNDGAKNLLVVDVPDLGKTPEVTSGKANGSNQPSAALDALASQLCADYNALLGPALVGIAQADGLDLHIADIYGLIDDAVANPAKYGLTNVTDPVWSGDFTDPNSGTLAADGAAQNQYLFFDDFHPTAAIHAFIAQAALQVLAGPPACFAAGTRILTAAGAIAIEQLRVGDAVCAQHGERLVPIVWLGHRRIDCRSHARPHNVWPVRIAAHAFGAGLPHRDLWLSPEHAIFVDGMLLPARCLVNGATIAQHPVSEITYWHLELAQHAVVLTEGLPAESYLDTGNRAAFTGAAEARPAERGARAPVSIQYQSGD